MHRVRWVHLLFCLLCLAALSCSKGGEKGTRTRPPPMVSVAKVQARDVAVEVHAPVDLRPLAQADVGSKALGYLDAVLVDRGDKVKRGQTVALVRPSDLPDQLTAARGVLAQAQASKELAKANYERAQALAPNGVVSQQQLQQSAASLATAEAAAAAAQAQIGALGVRLGETRIQSPMDGVVTVRRLDPGSLVGPPGGGAIVTVARIDVLRVFVAVNEVDARGLAIGKDARVELDALPGRSFSGKVVRLAPGFDPANRMLEAEVHLPNEQGELRPGMYGRGAILLETHPNAVVLAVNAMQISKKKKYVFVLLADNKVQRRPIEIGYDGGTWVEVVSGLQAGEEVVMAGAEGLSDGTTVRVARDVDPYSGAKTAAGASSGQGKAPDKVAD
ncbi:MAG: efflux RND transporter periplasmic adaptor subunit [Deltaproteobacteria bacterium]|nr:efflux RND transporter periplasmic adaptor subunit [Deltaproteobacteria bacterium]